MWLSGKRYIKTQSNPHMVLWCNWLTHLPVTQKSPGSNPGRIVNKNNNVKLLFWRAFETIESLKDTNVLRKAMQATVPATES